MMTTSEKQWYGRSQSDIDERGARMAIVKNPSANYEWMMEMKRT